MPLVELDPPNVRPRNQRSSGWLPPVWTLYSQMYLLPGFLINPNPRGRKQPKRGRKPIFEPAIFKERFRTIERVFAWEDKFRRLLLRFERISGVHYAFKTLAYTMINLRHYCQI